MSDPAPKRIGIAVVEHRGCYLIGERGPDVPLPGYSEFPGGKCLPEESPKDCAIRECLEETHLAITVERLILRTAFAYPHATVDLHFYLCHPADESSVHNQHNGYRWIHSTELPGVKFPEANAPVIELVSGGQ